ncbi:insulinase family protein [Chlamydia vaughanii]|uniref:insulinase family protein n=1 Tax=Chlamydia vaughanii TaxID=3112552 RepID=UPI0032B27455
MSWRILSAIVLVPLFLTSCNQQTRTIPDQCPLKVLTPSAAEQKIAKVLCPNGLPLLIISDPGISVSGAALTVKTGNSSDPSEFPGLAHLTEHCIFLGNKKYPDNDAFSNFLSNNNGTHNAFTSSYTTSYLFSIKSSAFLEAMDQFIHMFIQPLFRQEDLNKEKNAVHQEFAMHPTRDGRRVFRIQQLIAPQGDPINRFGCGNSDTLSQVSSQDMHKWFGRYYHPENMIAVVHTAEPIEKAIKTFSKIFAKIPTKKNHEIPSQSLCEDNLSSGRLYIISAVEPTAALEMYWHLYDTSPSTAGCFSALAYVVNHEGTNGLISSLKEENLITHADSGFCHTSQNTGAFSISYHLTEQGEKEYSKVIQRTFEYLHHIQKQGIPEYCLDDISTINSLEYCYSSKAELFNLLHEQVSSLVHEELSTYPYRSLVYPKYSPEQEKDLLGIVSDPYRTRYILSTKHPEHFQDEKKHHDVIFNMDYYEKSLPDLEIYKGAISSSPMSLPPANIYIPKNVEVLEVSKVERQQFPFLPTLAYKDSGLTFYYCDDEFYTLPKLAMNLRIRSPHISTKNIRSLIATDLYSLAINENLLKKYYLASQAGLSFATSLRGDGLSLSISGYNTTAPILLKSILSSLKISINEERFAVHKQQLMESYQKKISACPIRAGMNKLWAHTLQDVYPFEEKLSALQTMDFSEWQEFSATMFEKIHLEAMVLGPRSEKQKQELTAILKNFSSSHFAYEASPFYYQRQEESIQNIKLNYPLSGNAMLLVLQDMRSSSMESLVATEMMFSWLHHIAFTHLRTEQQLGYVIGACYQEPLLFPSGMFYIRSDAYTPQELETKTKIFIEKVATSPEDFGMSPEYFSELRDTYIKNLTHPTSSLESMGSTLFSLAFEKPSIQFSRADEKISAARNMDYAAFRTYCQEFLNQKLRSEIPIYVHGKKN